MKKGEFKFIITSFLGWRVLLLGFVFLAASFFPLQKLFLGGGIENYLKNPYFWSWINFDGEHYLSLALQGYLPLTYFYFPFYPMVVKFVSLFVGSGFKDIAVSGLFVSNISFLLALVGLWKLIGLDYKKDIAKATILFIVLFPTSFYFGSFYTESLFLALAVWSFYFARKGNWILAGTLGAVLTATRITGLALLPAIAYEVIRAKRENPKLNLFLPIISILLIPAGLGIYMLYLNKSTGNPLEFFSSIAIFGQQRSTNLVLLPQVFYRYFFKVIPNLTFSYFPVVFTTFLEIVTALIFLVLSVWAFFRLRLSYALYLAAGYLIPPLSGSFSSFPRYVAVLFPAFILMALWSKKLPKVVKTVIFLLLFATLALASMLFVRGYWVS